MGETETTDATKQFRQVVADDVFLFYSNRKTSNLYIMYVNVYVVAVAHSAMYLVSHQSAENYTFYAGSICCCGYSRYSVCFVFTFLTREKKQVAQLSQRDRATP